MKRFELTLDIADGSDGNTSIPHTRIATALAYVAEGMRLRTHQAGPYMHAGESGPIYSADGVVMGTWRVR